jgi:hypothetical protein
MGDVPPARILEVSPHAYHRLPGFSASLAKVLVQSCALKAKDAYDRRIEKIAAEDEADSEDEKPTDEKQAQLDRGSVLHALVLGKGEERIEVIPSAMLAKNGAYSTAEARAARDGARRAGKIPVKEPKMQGHLATADAIKATLESAGHVLDGRSEFAIEWHERTPHGPVLCRGMMDHVVLFGDGPADQPTSAIIYDLKIVADAHPDRCERSADNFGYAIQAAAYQRAINALLPSLAGRIQFRFLFIEPRRPFLLWDPERLSGPFREIGERQWIRAVHAWGEGLATGRWPDYRTPDRVEISAPMWRLKQEGFQPDDF